ncbi:MAG: RND family efflux transporter MFP subunit [Gammaproteobacteria bacterium]|jgi:RND family efflux transporter MFP subunit
MNSDSMNTGMGRRRLTIINALVALLTVGSIVNTAVAQDRAARVKVDIVRSEPISQTVPILGRVVTREGGVIAARVAGAVTTIGVQVGQRVEMGAVLATLDDSTRRAELARQDAEVTLERARLATARATLGLATQELKRLKTLEKTAAFPKARYDDKRQEVVAQRSTVTERQATVTRASANRRLAEIALIDSVVRASFPGVILRRHVSRGNYLRAGDPVVTMMNEQDMELEVDVPVERLTGLTNGTVVPMRLANGTQFDAKVRAIIPEENPLSRTRSVRLSPQFNAQTMVPLAANESVTAQVPIGAQRDIITVHKDAVTNRKGERIVYLVREDSASPRTVELGEAVGIRFEVLKGLSAHDLVVIRGNERLRPGQKVQFDAPQ